MIIARTFDSPPQYVTDVIHDEVLVSPERAKAKQWPTAAAMRRDMSWLALSMVEVVSVQHYAYGEGYDAVLAGGENLYPEGSDQWREWEDGAATRRAELAE